MYLGVLLDCLFQGFDCRKGSREVSLNWRRILVLRKPASVTLARALRSAVFRPLVARGSGVVHKRQGALGRGVRSSVLCSADFELHGGVVCGQLHSHILPSQPRRHSIASPQLHHPTYSQMGGVASSSVGSTIHYGAQQCSSRFSFQTQSNLRVGMDPEDRGLSGSSQEVPSFHRSFRHLSKSPMLSIFFSVPRSERSGHGCSAPELEWVAGVCFSSMVSHS